MNPNWQKADQLAIYKHSQEVELGAGSNIIWQSERDLNPEPKDFKSGASITQPRCLLNHSATLPSHISVKWLTL